MEFQEVTRPVVERRKHGQLAALLDTATTGNALRFAANGLPVSVLRQRISAYSGHAKRNGFQLRMSTTADKSAIDAWCEPLTTKL